jgi:signal peptidase I
VSFPALMVTLVAVTGVIWILDKWLWAPNRGPDEAEPVIVEYAKSFFPIILAVLIVRSFLIEPFRIPSASMVPTLRIGDFILVNKFDYGVRLPVLNSKIIEIGKPKRGDVVVFRYPPKPQIDYIKRVVGLPGDHVQYIDKIVYINGQAMVQQPQFKTGDLLGIVAAKDSVLTEQLGGVNHDMAISPGRQRIQVDIVIPDGEYFVMGDNRDNSSDSRFWGTVPEANLVGKAFYIWMSWDCNASKICINSKRIGNSIN